MTKKPYPKVRMVCALCHRPMSKAAALSGGLPVGPVCAVNAGLVPPRKQRSTLSDGTVVVRDTQTLDLFATP